MKRLLALLLIAALVGGVSATSLNFQNPGDFSQVICKKNPSYNTQVCKWVRSTSGGNNYVSEYQETYSGYGSYKECIMLPSAYQSTYAAGTYVGFAGGSGDCGMVVLFDANQNPTWQFGYSPGSCAISTNTRIELKMDGGIARVYKNGGVIGTSGVVNTPYFIGLCGHGAGVTHSNSWDDYVYGQTEKKYVAGLPESDNSTYIILQDLINPASSGLAFGENGTIVSSSFMSGTWSRGNASITPSTLENETIQLINVASKKVIATNYTGTAYMGTVQYNINSAIIDAREPNGYYALHWPDHDVYSNLIEYRSNGASVAWNQEEYSVGDTGTVVYYVLDGGYWDTSLYSYKVCILDSYMNFIQNTTLTASSGNVAYEWTEDNPEGVYHAWLIATNHDGYEYVLGSDYAELVAYFGYGGYVNDGYTTLPIEGANVNITQGLTALHNASSGYDGKYSTSPLFGTGSSVFFNVTKTGYTPYQYSFIPLSAGTIHDLNVTIYPTNPLGDSGGIGIGGVVRDSTIGRPISGATVYVFNTSTSEEYTKSTNAAGGYNCSAGDLCTLFPNRLYLVNASKVGYNVSINYPVVAAGAV